MNTETVEDPRKVARRNYMKRYMREYRLAKKNAEPAVIEQPLTEFPAALVEA